MHTLNQTLFLDLNTYAGHNTTLDTIMTVAAAGMPYLFIALLFYLWFTRRRDEALYAGYATTLGVVLDQVIGLFVQHNRPFMDHLGTTLLTHKPENSFPSDHTTFTLSIALMLLTFRSTRLLGIITTLLALWCGAARVYGGVHYPFDILGSVAVALVATGIITAFRSQLAGLNGEIQSVWNFVFKQVK